jgi:hypothetical protein
VLKADDCLIDVATYDGAFETAGKCAMDDEIIHKGEHGNVSWTGELAARGQDGT